MRFTESINIKLLNITKRDSLTPRLEGVIPIKLEIPEIELYRPTLEKLIYRFSVFMIKYISIKKII